MSHGSARQSDGWTALPESRKGHFSGAIAVAAMRKRCHPRLADYDLVAQMVSQSWGVCTTLVWSGIGSAILYKVVDVIVGLRANVETEREGLDITEHTERAYNM